VTSLATLGAGAAGEDTTITFSQITEATAQTISLDGTSMTASATNDLVIVNSAASATTKFSITGASGADTLIGSLGDDTLSGGTADDAITGGSGADTISLGAGEDDVLMTAAVAADGTLGVDTITGFVVADNDAIGAFSMANLGLLTQVTDIVDLVAATTEGDTGAFDVSAGSDTGNALDLTGLIAGDNILLSSVNYATTAAFQSDVRANVTAAADFTAGDAFFAAYDDGTTTTIALVSTAAGLAGKGLLADAVVTAVATLDVADATTLDAGAFTNFVA
jgi:hypothetical protein